MCEHDEDYLMDDPMIRGMAQGAAIGLGAILFLPPLCKMIWYFIDVIHHAAH